MKRLSYSCSVGIALLVLPFAMKSLADTDTPLQSDMKQIGALVKEVTTNLNDTSQNQTSASDMGQVASLFADAQNQTPDAITALPADQQAAALADYKSMIQQEIDLSQKMQSAFQANDNATASTLLGQMNAIKKDGHGKYNPQN